MHTEEEIGYKSRIPHITVHDNLYFNETITKDKLITVSNK